MRWKAPKKISHTAAFSLVDPTDVLVCARVPKNLPKDQLANAAYQFLKYGFLEEGRGLAYSAGQDYILVANLLDEASAGRVRENLARNPAAGLTLCETPADAAKHVKPWGQVFSGQLGNVVTLRLAEDADIETALLQKQAERMDRDPDGDYLIPNLPDDLYAAVKAAQAKKPE